MKKSLVATSAVTTAFALGMGVMVPYVMDNNHVFAEAEYVECYYVNSNQVSMTKNEYDLLRSIGFDDYEVDNMTESKFNKLMGMGFITSSNDIPMICDSGDGNSISSMDMSNLGSIDLQSHITTQTPRRVFVTYGNDKTMYTIVSFAKNKSGYQIYVKQNIFWKTYPIDQLTDIIAVNYNNSNLRVATIGNQLDVEAHLRYNNKYIYYYKEDVEWELVDEKLANSQCCHELGKYVAFKAPIPKEKLIKDGAVLGYNLVVTMEVAFDTNLSNMLGTEIQTYYAHQIDGESINSSWSLEFSPTPPYISVSLSVSKDKQPKFEALRTSVNITFDDEWLSRC